MPMIPQTYQRGGMPMVPETFAPDVNEGEVPMVPATAPGVRPMQNAAPGALAQTAQAAGAAGALATRLGNTIGDRVQETMDDATVRNADTQFLNTANDVVTKYTRSLGLDAINGLEPAQQAIAKAKQDAAANLTNPVQQQMFAQMVAARLPAYGKQLADHQFQQHIQYGVQAGNDRSDALVQQAANNYDDWQRPDGNFAKNKAMAVHEAQEAALLLGQPVDSAQSQALVKQKTTALAQGVLTRMMDKEQFAEAQQYLDANKDEINERQYEMLSNAVLNGHSGQKMKNLAAQQEQAALGAGAAKIPPGADEYMAVSDPKGLVERGNLPIWNRPTVQNADGTHSSEYSVSFEDDQGREVLVPTVVNGKFLTPDGKKPPEGSAAEKTMFKAAWDYYLKTGENLGKFDNAADADVYAQKLHSRPVISNSDSGTFLQPRLYPVAGGSITSTMGAPRPGGRVHDGVDIAVPVGTSVRAPANGTVSKVWNDDQFGGGLSMEITYPNGNVEGFAHLSAANYKPGQQVTQGTVVALTGKSGDATGPVLHWAMKDANGNWIDPRSAGGVPKSPDGFTTPEQLEKAIAGVNASDETQLVKDGAIRQLKSDYGTARTLQDQKYQEVKQDALDYYYGHNYSLDGYPADKKMQLKPQDLASLTPGPAKPDDFATAFQFLSGPKEDQTMANLNGIAGSLTAKTYKELATKVLNLQNSVEAFPPANVPHDMFTDALRTSGFANLVNAKDPDDQKRFSQLRTSIEQTATGEQQVLNRKLKPEEWNKIINDTLTQHVFVERGHWLPGIGLSTRPESLPGLGASTGQELTLYGRHYGVEKPLAGVSEDELGTTYVMSGGKKVHLADIPAAARMRYTTQLVMANSRLPVNKQLPITEQAIADAWVAHGRPKQ